MQYYIRATIEFCIYKWMLNEKYKDVSVMNRHASFLGLWLSRQNTHGSKYSQVVLRYMEWKITSADCFQSWRQTCSKSQAQQPVKTFHLLLSLFMTRFWLAHQSLCCITHRLSSPVHGDYLLPYASEGPVLFALYSLLLERNSLLLVMRLLNFLEPVTICFQEPTCIEL